MQDHLFQLAKLLEKYPPTADFNTFLWEDGGVLHTNSTCFRRYYGNARMLKVTLKEILKGSHAQICENCLLDLQMGRTTLAMIAWRAKSINKIIKNKPTATLEWIQGREQLASNLSGLIDLGFLKQMTSEILRAEDSKTETFMKANKDAFKEALERAFYAERGEKESFNELTRTQKRLIVKPRYPNSTFNIRSYDIVACEVYPRCGALVELPVLYRGYKFDGPCVEVEKPLTAEELDTLSVLVKDGGVYGDLREAYRAATKL